MHKVTTGTAGIGAVTSLTPPEEQHLLLLFLPLKTGGLGAEKTGGSGAEVVSALQTLFSLRQASDASAPFDPRPATGVHFFMVYLLKAGTPPGAQPPFPVFHLPPPNPDTGAVRNLAVVMAIYDADFGPYIGAFTSDEKFAQVLDLILLGVDETGFVEPSDPTSAEWILKNGRTFANQDAFVAFLMRYNWADPTRPAATSNANIATQNPNWKPYFLGTTFPGLTVTKILNTVTGYPNAGQLYPVPVKAPKIDYATSVPPI